MKYQVLGRTGLKVSILGFGKTPIRRVSEKEAIDVRLIDRSIEVMKRNRDVYGFEKIARINCTHL